MRKVLVTGGNGQLAQSLKLQRKHFPDFSFSFLGKKDLDITNKDQLVSFFKDNTFDFCINCAAYTGVEQAEITPDRAFAVNAEGVKNLALQCKKYQVVLIHVSTDYVFDGLKKGPYRTDDTPNPINEYGKSKLLGEQYIRQCLSHYYIVRTSWLYNKKYGSNFYRTIVKKARENETLYITDQQIGCPTNAENLSRYLVELITTQREYGVYHFCDGKAMTWFEFARKIIKENNLNVNVVKGSISTRAKRPKNSVLE